MVSECCDNRPFSHAFPEQSAAFSELISLARLVRGAKPDRSEPGAASAESLRQMIIEIIHSPSLQERFLKAVETP